MPTDRYRYAIIGTGRPHGSEGATGFGMAHYHIRSFLASERADLIAIAEIRDDNARLFLDKHESKARHYHDYREMLAEEKPDIVSICVWPHLHAEMTIAAAEAGVKGIHCEKPMATTWADAKRMKAAAEANGAVLTFNHQRRFIPAFAAAKKLAHEGEIGALQRIEANCGDLYDWGTHWFDMLFFLNDETPAAWVLGQIDSRKEHIIFGVPLENQGLCWWRWANGVYGLMTTGFESRQDAAMRLHGSEGTVEIKWDLETVRSMGKAGGSEEVFKNDGQEIARACADLIHALDTPGYQPLLSAENALRSTEVIFATYLSSKRRGRIDLPLTYEGNALLEMFEEGVIGPERHV